MKNRLLHTPDQLTIPAELQAEAVRAAAATGYPLSVTRHFADRSAVVGGSYPGALLRQVLPSEQELTEETHFTTNPLLEQAPTPEKISRPFLLQKYAGRALLMTTTECFGNCRFCFRRHLRRAAEPHTPTLDDFSESVFAVAHDTSLREIILSGGDPLTLDDRVFFGLLRAFGRISHLRRVRIHTRAPIFEPTRISEKFLETLGKYSANSAQTLYFVVHINHPGELGPESTAALRGLREANVALLQQGVLLRGVNDRADTLCELYETLSDLRVLPYYLHQLDRVAGATHFEVAESEGLALMRELRCRLPGYAVPRYVREIPGEPAKTPLQD